MSGPRRLHPVPWVLVMGAAWAASPGCDDPSTPTSVAIDSTVVASVGVEPDPARTYEADRADADPDSTLTALGLAGLPVEVAWRPIAYLCEDVRGGRLTVQLTRPDARMAGHDFSLGTGRLRCSQTLVRYVLSWIYG